uniref:Non-structural maintenance of chromosomes element 3 homolog n=1 Tax=Ciona intestinalis TaxID=7719 RepID=F6PMB4_CIOIN|nr:non-structural maintenance of chromosomes element 3 homolog isoform X1 [Ciona intestinalis]|eukprot:XP_026690501.1 non-structural maintenance of chromosomes element 3 homolog isoform X1 [Ciona intestinalis]
MSSSQRNIDKSELDRKVNDVVHLMLIWEQRKIPIKRADINKHVLKEYRHAFNEVMKITDKKLQKVFGLKLLEIGESGKRAYILVNMLEHSETQQMMNWNDNPKRGLLFTVLSLIFMCGNSMTDGTFWNALKGLGIEKDKPHPEFGDVKKLITQEFVRQWYLEIVKLPNCDPPQYEYKWGLRAYHETSKMKILEFVTSLYDKSSVMVWKSQYQDALEEQRKTI